MPFIQKYYILCTINNEILLHLARPSNCEQSNAEAILESSSDVRLLVILLGVQSKSRNIIYQFFHFLDFKTYHHIHIFIEANRLDLANPLPTLRLLAQDHHIHPPVSRLLADLLQLVADVVRVLDMIVNRQINYEIARRIPLADDDVRNLSGKDCPST
jgi:hypothetical protein